VKKKVLIWKFDPLGSRAHLCTCSLLLGSSDVSFPLKEKVLTWRVDLRGRGHVYVLGLFTRDLQSSFFSFRREGFDLERLSFRKRKFDLRESLDGRLGSLGMRPWSRQTLVRHLGVLGEELIKALKGGMGLFIEKTSSP